MGQWSSMWTYEVTGPKGQSCTFAFDRALSEAEQAYLRECAAEGRWEEIQVLTRLVEASA